MRHRYSNSNSPEESSTPLVTTNAAAATTTPTTALASSAAMTADDADAAAGAVVDRLLAVPMGGGSASATTTTQSSSSYSKFHIEKAPPSTLSISRNAAGELEFFEDLVSEPVLVLGMDITHMSRKVQFLVCACGVFFFSLLYGYLQELISVQLCSRKLGLFLAQVQFSGYTLLAYVLRQFVYEKERKHNKSRKGSGGEGDSGDEGGKSRKLPVPLMLYLGLSLLRAVDLGMTNLAMQYINYPAKTLMKSSRVVFTMLFGVVIGRKRYQALDYMIVFAMVAGLAVFMHADANSSAVFHHMGVVMLTVSLVCDGAISNLSESIMTQFGVGQDEFIFRMYSISLVAITMAAAYKGDMTEGMLWLSQPGTYNELALPISERTWSVPGKVACLVLFSSMGFFGSSCAAAITKQFGALTMSITSTARKATTLFLSFLLFNNVCTMEHIAGMVVFISALTAKSLRRRKDKKHGRKSRKHKQRKSTEPLLHQPPISTIDSLELGKSRSSDADDHFSRSKGSLVMRRSASQDSADVMIPPSTDRVASSNRGGGGGVLVDRDGTHHRNIHVV